MKIGQRKSSDVIGILFTILVGILTIVFGAIAPEMAIMALISLIAIFFGIMAYWIADYIVYEAKKKITQLNDNTEEIKNIKKEMKELNGKLDFHNEVAKLKIRIDSMENKKTKKGAIDPRIIIAIIIVIFLIIYLRTLGYF